ncbi:MAG TPA: hypothetical protein VLA24_09370 [Pseudomonadales bacterium]|nr:hypothetical protein [Pseudomonadales bacterium]
MSDYPTANSTSHARLAAIAALDTAPVTFDDHRCDAASEYWRLSNQGYSTAIFADGGEDVPADNKPHIVTFRKQWSEKPQIVTFQAGQKVLVRKSRRSCGFRIKGRVVKVNAKTITVALQGWNKLTQTPMTVEKRFQPQYIEIGGWE